MGLYVMAMLDTVIQDYRDGIDILPALLPRWRGKPIAFRNLHLRDGLVASGRWHDGALELELRATMDVKTAVRIHPAGRYLVRQAAGEHAVAGGEQFALDLAAGDVATVRNAGARNTA